MIRTGTSGWYYQHWKGVFYPPELPKSRYLSYYTATFDTVEINNSFYHLPKETTFDTWRAAAPPGFVYSVKASRYLTHLKRLKDPEEGLKLFMDRAFRLGPSLGPVLFQLPPRFAVNVLRLEAFLELLPPGTRAAFEFRDSSWYCEEVYKALSRKGAALCVQDRDGSISEIRETAPFFYVRFHGPGKAYAGDYPSRDLETWARRMQAWQAAGLDVYTYFNNDPGGYAVENAKQLRALVEGG